MATLRPDLRAPLERYLALLLQWNERINLTAIRDPAEVWSKHFEDSLAVVPHVASGATSLVDVGSGAGFPGAVVALARPDLQVTLAEPNAKKAAFLEAVRRELRLGNLRVERKRLEDLPDRAFDVAVSRATFDLLDWLRDGRRLVKPGGLVLGMEGGEQRDLPEGTVRHPYRIGDATRAIIVEAVAAAAGG